MDLENLPSDVVGTVEKVQLQNERNNQKYFHIYIKEQPIESLKAQPGNVIQILIRNTETGETATFTRELERPGNQYKIYLPKPVAEKINAKEEMLVDLFLRKT